MFLSFSEVKCVSFANIKISQVQYHKEMFRECMINSHDVPFNVFLGVKFHQNAKRKRIEYFITIYIYFLNHQIKRSFFWCNFLGKLDYAF